jgi:hypothetical protein
MIAMLQTASPWTAMLCAFVCSVLLYRKFIGGGARQDKRSRCVLWLRGRSFMPLKPKPWIDLLSALVRIQVLPAICNGDGRSKWSEDSDPQEQIQGLTICHAAGPARCTRNLCT